MTTAKELIEKALSQTASFFEKATELRFLLHLLCVVSYLEIALYVATGHAMPSMSWKELEGLSPSTLLLSALGYFALMGYVFRLLYFVVFRCVSALAYTSFFSAGKTHWHQLRGYVCETDVLRKTYASKDYEPLRMLDEHRKRCGEDRRETKELAYLSFAALCFGLWGHYLIPGAFLTAGYAQLSAFAGERTADLTLLVALLPLFLIWLDASYDHDRERYMNHDPLYKEIEEERRKEKEERGY